MLTRATLVFGIILLLSNCNQANDPTSMPSVLVPLEVGNSWQYAQTWARLDSVAPDTTITMDVRHKDTVDTFVGYYLNNMIIAPFRLWGSLPMLANRSDGLYTAQLSYVVPTGPPLVARALSYPTFAGDTLTYLQYRVRTQSTSSSVSVPAGTFDCIEYMFLQNDDTVATIWCKPNLGLIKTWTKYGLVQYTHKLVSYFLK